MEVEVAFILIGAARARGEAVPCEPLQTHTVESSRQIGARGELVAITHLRQTFIYVHTLQSGL